VRLVATGVAAMASTVTAREAQERHRSHAGGTQNHAEYVEVHLSAHVVREFSSAMRRSTNPRTKNPYVDSVIHVSATQLNSGLSVRIDTQRRAEHWHAFAAARWKPD